ncbi:MAG: hypothetical protein E7667_05585 [Ruminococcaceae bacterium]|nr:hypothetical protein [Oscillospiraceae bacterium]
MDKKSPKVIYYRDELNDEFSKAQITPKRIDASYRYERKSFFAKAAHVFLYRFVAIPIAFVYLKVKFGHKIINKKALKPFRKKACFIYGNHTQTSADPLIPTFITFPYRANIIVHPNNVSIPIVGGLMPYLGAIPLPDDMAANRNFIKCIEARLQKGQAVFIYPEAHIWPYFTGIRNFKDTSFFYPVKYDTPVFCFTNTYQRRKWRKTPRMVTYIDGPFYKDTQLPPRVQKSELRDRVYECMCERAKNSNVTIIKYVKEETIDD